MLLRFESAIPNLAAICASIYHTIHALTLTLILVGIADQYRYYIDMCVYVVFV